jgi:hypothetical protein
LLFSENLGISQGMPDDPCKTRERIETLLREALTLTQRLPQSESVQEAAATMRRLEMALDGGAVISRAVH